MHRICFLFICILPRKLFCRFNCLITSIHGSLNGGRCLSARPVILQISFFNLIFWGMRCCFRFEPVPHVSLFDSSTTCKYSPKLWPPKCICASHRLKSLQTLPNTDQDASEVPLNQPRVAAYQIRFHREPPVRSFNSSQHIAIHIPAGPLSTSIKYWPADYCLL